MTSTRQMGWRDALRHTPLTDLLRGQVTARLNWQGRIIQADLTEAAKQTIFDTVRYTRLSKREMAEVTGDLIAHFADAQAAGVAADAVLGKFGDARSAAKLIRRAKLRNRGPLWQAYKWFRRSVGVAMLIYALLAIRLWMARPTPAIDFFARINAPIFKTPLDARAWPVYVEAMAGVGDFKRGPNYKHFDEPEWVVKPEWLASQGRVVELIRQAAAKPSLGFVLGNRGSANDIQRLMNAPEFTQPDSLLVYATLPHLNRLRQLADIIDADADAARSARDSARLKADIVTLFGIADHTGQDGFIISGLVGTGIRHMAIGQVTQTLVRSPDLFGDADLIELAHRLGHASVAADVLSMDVERMGFDDFVQHAYTDDGEGDGHADGRLTVQGLDLLESQAHALDKTPLRIDLDWNYAEAPAFTAIAASRREVVERHQQLLAITESRLAKPMRELDQAGSVRAELDRLKQSPLAARRFGVLLTLTPTLEKAQVSTERDLANREGMAIGIALELYHRQFGQYPPTLDVLCPRFLPKVPVDRITGGPLHYVLVDGHPRVYSVGADLKDDGGAPPRIKELAAPNLAGQWFVDPKSAAQGDWVIYPGHQDL